MSEGQPVVGQIWLVFHLRRLPHWYVSTKVPLFDPRGKLIGLAGAMYGIAQPDDRARYFRELYPVVTHIEAHFAENISAACLDGFLGLRDGPNFGIATRNGQGPTGASASKDCAGHATSACTKIA